MPDERDERQVTVMAMAMSTMGREATGELDSSGLERVPAESKDSDMVIVNSGPGAILAAVAKREVVLRLLLLALREAAE